MRDAPIYLVSAPTNILSTLDPMQSTRLERIKLITTCICKWICKGSRDQLAQAWSDLDTVLSEVANRTKGRKLTFSLASTQKGLCVPSGKKWLPELLPRFHQLGELRVEYERGRLGVGTGRGCVCDHSPSCVEEERGDFSQN
jgi:hypothetical protein